MPTVFRGRNTLFCCVEGSEFLEKNLPSRIPDNSMETRKGSVSVLKWLPFSKILFCPMAGAKIKIWNNTNIILLPILFNFYG